MNRQSFSVLEVEPRATSILGNCSAAELHSQPSLLTVFYVINQCRCPSLFWENLWLGPLPSQGNQREQGWSLNKVAATASFVRRKSWVFHFGLISPMLPCYPWASTSHWKSPATHGRSWLGRETASARAARGTWVRMHSGEAEQLQGSTASPCGRLACGPKDSGRISCTGKYGMSRQSSAMYASNFQT